MPVQEAGPVPPWRAPPRTIIVRGLAGLHWGQAELSRLFSSHEGSVVETRINDAAALITFIDAKTAYEAVCRFHRADVEGQTLNVKLTDDGDTAFFCGRPKGAPDKPDYDYMTFMVTQHQALLQQCDSKAEERKSRILSEVMEVCGSLRADAYHVGSATRNTQIDDSDIDVACLFPKGRTRIVWQVENAMHRLSESVRHMSDYFNHGIDSNWSPISGPTRTLAAQSLSTVPLETLLYSHDTISKRFADGRRLADLVKNLSCDERYHLDNPNLCLECFRHSGQIHCLNNRRLWCLKQCQRLHPSRSIQVRIWFGRDASQARNRFTSVNGGVNVHFRSNESDDESDAPTGDDLNSVKVRKSRGAYIRAECDGVRVDILVGFKLAAEALTEQAMAASSKQDREHLAAACAVEHTKLSWSSSTCEAIRLAKLWINRVAFPQWDNQFRPKGFLIELMVSHVGKVSWTRDAWDIFRRWLELCASAVIPPIYGKWQHHHQLRTSSKRSATPLVLDPCNPTNNVAQPFRRWSDLQRYAESSLRMIRAEQLKPSMGLGLKRVRSVPMQALAEAESDTNLHGVQRSRKQPRLLGRIVPTQALHLCSPESSASSLCEDEVKRLRSELSRCRSRAEAAEQSLARMQVELNEKRTCAEGAETEVTQLRHELAQANEWADKELETWRHQTLKAPLLLSPRPHLVPLVQKMLRQLVPPNHNGECSKMRSVVVKSVERVANMRLWKQYLFKRQMLCEALQEQHGYPVDGDINRINPKVEDLQRLFPHMELEAQVNEVLLLHGTKDGSVDQIVHQGFDERLSRRSLYGQGVYFTTDPCKVDQYCGDVDDSPVRTMILARVLLGNPFFAEGPMQTDSRPPLVHATGLPHDSIVAQPGIPNGKGKGQGKRKRKGKQAHWEFVVSHGSLQVYPELIIRFELP